MHAQLKAENIRHAHIDADNLDMIYPAENGPELLKRNLTSLVHNYYHFRGCTWFIISGTALVLDFSGILLALADGFGNWPGGRGVDVRPFILTAEDRVIIERLRKREVGSTLDEVLASSVRMATSLEDKEGGSGVRVPTGGQSVQDLATYILENAYWI